MNPRVSIYLVMFSFLLTPFIGAFDNGATLIILGLWLVFAFLWFVKTYRYILNNGVRTEGFLVKMEYKNESWMTEYEFTTLTGKEIIGNTFLGQYVGEAGDAISVLYHPKYPKTFLVEEGLPKPEDAKLLIRIVVVVVLILFTLGSWLLFK